MSKKTKTYRLAIAFTGEELLALGAVIDAPFVGDDDDLAAIVGAAPSQMSAARSMRKKMTNAVVFAQRMGRSSGG